MFCLCLLSLYFLIRDADYLWLILTFFVWVLVSGLGIGCGFHRIYSHRCATNVQPWLDNILLFLGTLALQGSSITWVAVHRGYHHPHSDRYGDLHSPTHGIFHSILGWYFTTDPRTINNIYAQDLVRKRNHVFFHRHYVAILWLLGISLALIDTKVFLYGFCLPATISFFQDNLVNWFCHDPRFGGYALFQTKDNSRNHPILSWFTFGLALHNNHHRFPGRFNFDSLNNEFDPAILFKPLLQLGCKFPTQKHAKYDR